MFSEKGLVVGGWQTSNPAPLKGKTQVRKDCKLLGYPQKRESLFWVSLFFYAEYVLVMVAPLSSS